jgi:hypothetical protein
MVGRSTGSLDSMTHWHPYAKGWAFFLVSVGLIYTSGSPVYLWALGQHLTVEAALVTMVYAAITASVIALPLLAIGVVAITLGARVANHRRNKSHHAA